MNEFLKSLEPQQIWQNFAHLLSIPRPSKKEAAVIEFMKNFGENLGLFTLVDENGNVIIRKPASPGMENRPGVILQAHLDMVPQKNSDKIHDFEKDPIVALPDGDWVKADGTTLGADNGIGAAAAMAVLQDKNLVHGPIEALFTIDEETGMTGAFNLKPGILEGKILLNLDSEDEGELYVGCAGGIDANVSFTGPEIPVPQGWSAWKLTVKGLKGGHSGLDIHIGRGNANKLLFRYLKHAVRKHGIRLASVDGGSLRNAIPREAFAIIVAPADKHEPLRKCVAEYAQTYKNELALTEPDLYFGIESVEVPQTTLDTDLANRLIHAVYACPNGVIRMNDAFPGLVETSTNLAIVKSDKGNVSVLCLLRSSVDSAKDDLAEMTESVFLLAGAHVNIDGGYPGWKPNPDSRILQVMKDTYQALYQKVPDVKAIHAGLECGILGGAYPHWDMISFGPTIRYPHSPDEKVNVPSVQKFWIYLLETLKNIPAETK